MTPHDFWPAPTASAPVRASVRVPGSKSATNRALVLAALCNGPSLIREALDARDTRLMIKALEALGAEALRDLITYIQSVAPKGR